MRNFRGWLSLRVCAVLAAAAALASLPQASAQELVTVTWPTKLASEPPDLPDSLMNFMPAFRTGLAMMTEDQAITLALSQPSLLGLDPKVAAALQQRALERYRLINADPLFSKAQSALPYCYSEQTPTSGQASVYLPKNATDKTPVFVFLHGDGGSFIWYQHLLAEVFPDHIIICPAYGVTPAYIPPDYVTECLDAVTKKLGHALAPPKLIGLSAGGFSACRVYTKAPSKFPALLVIAAYPPEETLPLFTKKMNATFIAGGTEPYVTDKTFQNAMDALHAQGVQMHSTIIPDADHFFLLFHKDETMELLGKWDAATTKSPVTKGKPSK